MTVLVVDDERLIRWALHEALASKGYRVLEAEDGETARQRLGTKSTRAVYPRHAVGPASPRRGRSDASTTMMR